VTWINLGFLLILSLQAKFNQLLDQILVRSGISHSFCAWNQTRLSFLFSLIVYLFFNSISPWLRLRADAESISFSKLLCILKAQLCLSMSHQFIWCCLLKIGRLLLNYSRFFRQNWFVNTQVSSWGNRKFDIVGILCRSIDDLSLFRETILAWQPLLLLFQILLKEICLFIFSLEWQFDRFWVFTVVSQLRLSVRFDWFRRHDVFR
jgi:hypothetical protein